MPGYNTDTSFKKTVKAVHRLETVLLFPPKLYHNHHAATAANTTANNNNNNNNKAGLRPTPLSLPEFFDVFALYMFPSGVQDLFVQFFFFLSSVRHEFLT
jgi:hypothetical protein